MNKPPVLIIAVLVLAGCGASGASFKQEAIESLGENETIIYIYRPDTLVGIINFDVSFLHLNGKSLGRIRIGGYLPIVVSQGVYDISTTESMFGNDTGKILAQAKFEVKPGPPVYLRYTEDFEHFIPLVIDNFAIVSYSGAYRFELVSPEEAMPEISKTELLETME